MTIIMVAGSLGNVLFPMVVAQLFGAIGPSAFAPCILGPLLLTALALLLISALGSRQRRRAASAHEYRQLSMHAP